MSALEQMSPAPSTTVSGSLGSGLLLLAFSTTARAYISTLYWAWFAVPFGAPPLPWQVLFAAGTFVGYLSHSPKREADRPSVRDLWMEAVSLHLFALAAGWASSEI